MAIFEYRCRRCGFVFEVEYKKDEIEKGLHRPENQKCPKCGGDDVERLFAPPSLRFVGSGFYVNDYGKGGSQ